MYALGSGEVASPAAAIERLTPRAHQPRVFIRLACRRAAHDGGRLEQK
jgi:hypothetical protein